MQLWYDAVESEQYSLLRVWESYEAAYVSYFADKAASATANLYSVLPCSLSPHKRCPRRGIYPHSSIYMKPSNS